MKKIILSLMFVPGWLFLYGLGADDGYEVRQLSRNDFARFIDQDFAVVDFYSPGCAPCRRYAPVFAEVALEMGEIIAFGKINVNEEIPLCEEYNIRYIPTTIIFKEGVECKRRVGWMGSDELRKFIEKGFK